MNAFNSCKVVTVEKVIKEIVEQETVMLEMTKEEAGKLKYLAGMNISIPRIYSSSDGGYHGDSDRMEAFLDTIRVALDSKAVIAERI